MAWHTRVVFTDLNFKMSIRYRPPPKRLVGWRYAVFIGTIVGSIALAAYPVIISPMINPDYYSEYFQA